ncbi:MAG TPA: thioredoxin family protein [Bryobacteraceae bacterium]|nr:thioredoxin family protein [Bryobacteraceae bacterium]
MPIAESAITPARFAQGLTYAAFLECAAVNRDKFEQNYRNPALTEDDLAFFRRAASLPHGPRKLLAIAEAWCGDVYRELPTAVRIAEAAGMELRIFLRDHNPDIMDEFVSNGGKARAIPVFVFYTGEMQYIAHFTERSASAHAGLAAAMKEARLQLNLPETATLGNLQEPRRTEFLQQVIARIQPFSEQWRRDAIGEIRQLLAEALRLPTVYTIRGCSACVKLLEKWEAEGVAYNERRVETSQDILDEARGYGSLVPIVVWPDGRVEQGFGESLGCFI